ncbi:MAG: hypothetical protein SAK29_24040 [Scytonema sp. PMC 1069.18]|nr:hypothetical protein [Scytonema sp. PMC 1069.18]MEC4885570.1 hypothetical protein [Scytonema sp. PMC 1070.18]
MKKNQYSRLFKLTAKLFKYFLIAIFGLAIACVIAMSFGALKIVTVLLSVAGSWFLKLGIILLCLIITTIILESLR